MPSFTYTGDEPRDYSDFGRVNPGDVLELDADPNDGRWLEAPQTPVKAESAPATPTPDPTN